MATNHFKNAWKQLISIIKTEYSRFADTGRIFVSDKILWTDINYDDGILIHPISDELLGERTKGRDDAFHIDLVYFKRYHPRVDYEDLTDFSENLIDLFETNRKNTIYWHYLGVVNVDLSIEIPVDEEGVEIPNVYGFTMSLIILRGKYD